MLTTQEFPSWSELSALIEKSVTKAVIASVAQAMTGVQKEVADLNAKLSTMDSKLSAISTEVTQKIAAHSTRLTTVEQQLSHLAIQHATTSMQTDSQAGTLTQMEKEMNEIKTENVKSKQAFNDLEQQTRNMNLRITGLRVQGHTANLEIYSFLRDKLHIPNIRESDITKVSMIFKKKTSPSLIPSSELSSASKPALIVTFNRKEIRDEVLTNRRRLKGTHIGISEDLTLVSSQFIATHRKDPRLKNIWSWNGRISLTLVGEDIKRSINPFLPLDKQLSTA